MGLEVGRKEEKNWEQVKCNRWVLVRCDAVERSVEGY
jgi:hypothetical protein